MCVNHGKTDITDEISINREKKHAILMIDVLLTNVKIMKKHEIAKLV